jgi:N-acetylglutamate synthase-like GNAT family acetyltransferase
MGLDWHRFILAVSPSGEMLGCGQLKPHDDGSLELASIAVRAAHRRQGVARAIIERLIAGAPRPLYLTCRSRLGPFYEQWGFRSLEPAEMPPHFRRLARLARTMFAFSEKGETLLVMKLK